MRAAGLALFLLLSGCSCGDDDDDDDDATGSPDAGADAAIAPDAGLDAGGGDCVAPAHDPQPELCSGAPPAGVAVDEWLIDTPHAPDNPTTGESTPAELDRVRVDNDVILRHLATGVLTSSASGNVAYLNPAAEQVLGLHALETRGKPLTQALPERLRPLRALILDTLARREPRARAEVRGTPTRRRQGGAAPAHGRVEPFCSLTRRC